MILKTHFNVETRLLNGKIAAPTYWENKPLELNCKNDPELTAAMLVIQRKIGEGRYQQVIAPILEPEINFNTAEIQPPDK